MVVLSCNNLCKSFGTNIVIDNISFNLLEGDKAGLVGINGAGKSTLFKMLTNEITHDSGEIYIQKNKSIGYLSQGMTLDSSSTLMEEMLKVYQNLINMEKKIRKLEVLISSKENMMDKEYHESLLGEYSDLIDKFEMLDGYSYMSSVKAVLFGLGFSETDFDKKINNFSGGQKTRAALCKLLLKKPDILLLDEPTNHLDLEAVEWLENFLKAYKGCLFIISHDRYFLDMVTNKIFELDSHKLDEYGGNYSSYIKQREIRKENLIKQYGLQQKEIQRQEAIIERFRSYNREKSIKQAESREKALERMEKIERPDKDHAVARISFTTRVKSGNDVLNVCNLSKSYNKKLFSGLNFEIKRGERVALIGPNGVGKTTLFKIILGIAKQDEGEIILGHNVNIGYYDQEQANLDESKKIIDEVWDAYPDLTQTRLRTILGAFLFFGEDVFKDIKLLSGGEKSRVALIKLMLSESNFLLLDEPTNNLDIISKEALEKAILNYDGTIFTISHDRYFLNKVATRIIYLDNEKGITEYPGNYSYYIEKKERPTRFYEPEQEASVGLTKTAIREERRKKKEIAEKEKNKKEIINAIEQEIAEKEKKTAELKALMCQSEVYRDPEKSQKVHDEMKTIKIRLDELYKKWEEKIN
ncbi:MAG: ABC-F family ATP-binding cassette domain-containing protein [Clostridiales bacterium]|nr:ABC-F family ATP-binding cassette domain-containing protein [Clostridiales bacterium]